MIWPLKYILFGAIGGTALIATPVVVTQLPSPSRTLPNKIACHGFQNFGLRVNGRVVTFAAEKSGLEQENQELYSGKGEIFEGDGTSCSN